ncbi:hypothetical protein UlMin_004299 [Ulmus minor]
MGRAPCCDKNNVKKGPWSPEEDTKLKAYIETYGTGGNWIALPQKIGLKRCGKSCRLRWLNYLRPNIKHGGFSEEEDNIICSLYISIGSRWSIIAAQLPGRTDNDIKNYWNTRLKKKLLGRRKQSGGRQSSSLDMKDQSNGLEETEVLSNSALERLQLHMQLQNLQNPFSFYNNPALWPKLHPFQQKMVQNLQSLNENQNNPLFHQAQTNVNLYQPPTNNAKIEGNNPKIGSSENPSDGSNAFINVSNPMEDHETNIVPNNVHGLEQSNGGIEQVSGFDQVELDEILNNQTVSFMSQGDQQMNEFDCFKDMSASKESLMWWCNAFEGKSASSNSWDSSSSAALQSNGMFHDYDQLGYSL